MHIINIQLVQSHSNKQTVKVNSSNLNKQNCKNKKLENRIKASGAKIEFLKNQFQIKFIKFNTLIIWSALW